MDMQLEIDQKTISATTRCRKGFACLHCNDNVYCPIEDCIMGKIHFIKCLHEQPCGYKAQLNGFSICTCPTRKEIYNRYRL
jgi:hypothetical protein